jgi:hypothetical protein
MSPTDAAKLLDLPADATPEQLEARFLELRRKLEDKIAKAPTPGLQAKYRESLAEITTAFEALTLAADSSSLPVASKTAHVGSPLAATSPTRSAQAPTLHSRPKSGGKEFLLVAVIAVVVLAAGGWFVLKTRSENAEKARVAAEQKAEAERLAEAARIAAEAKQKAEEEEKVRVAAAAKAEQERLEKLAAQVRVQFAETKLLWEQAQRAEREAQGEVESLRSSLRSGRDLSVGQRRELEARLEAHEAYFRWLADQLVTHPARRAGVRTEELLGSRQAEAAAESLAEYQRELTILLAEIKRRLPSDYDLLGSLVVSSEPAGVEWVLTDAFGTTHSGRTPTKVDRVAAGSANLVFRRPGWKEETVQVRVTARKEANTSFSFRAGGVEITSKPSGAEVLLNGAKVGRTPLTLSDLPTGQKSIELRLEGHQTRSEKITVTAGETARSEFALTRLSGSEALADFTTRYQGTWTANYGEIVFYCQIEAGRNVYTEWHGNGRFANQRNSYKLVFHSATPPTINRVMNDGRVLIETGEPLVVGRFLERDGQLIYQFRARNGKDNVDLVMTRSSQ